MISGRTRSSLSQAETRESIRAWTGNDDLDGIEFLIFGEDGTGGYAAFWNVRPGAPILEQPIVFLGSEGEVGVIARNFGEYLWLLADGVGPCEAVEEPERPPALASTAQEFRQFAEAHAGTERRTAAEVLDAARREYPDFENHILKMCR